MREIFKSERYFTFFDFAISHGQLLLRSQKSDILENNIDIIFYGTTYIQLFGRLNGLGICRIENSISDFGYGTVRQYLEYDNNYLFEIESNNEKYFIAASYVTVFENQLEFSQSSLNAIGKDRGAELATSLKT